MTNKSTINKSVAQYVQIIEGLEERFSDVLIGLAVINELIGDLRRLQIEQGHKVVLDESSFTMSQTNDRYLLPATPTQHDYLERHGVLTPSRMSKAAAMALIKEQLHAPETT